jgi:hypothetical protein
MSDSALNRWEALQRRTKADRLNAIEAFLSVGQTLFGLHNCHGCSVRMQHRGRHHHVGTNQTYHQDKNARFIVSE